MRKRAYRRTPVNQVKLDQVRELGLHHSEETISSEFSLSAEMLTASAHAARKAW